MERTPPAADSAPSAPEIWHFRRYRGRGGGFTFRLGTDPQQAERLVLAIVTRRARKEPPQATEAWLNEILPPPVAPTATTIDELLQHHAAVFPRSSHQRYRLTLRLMAERVLGAPPSGVGCTPLTCVDAAFARRYIEARTSDASETARAAAACRNALKSEFRQASQLFRPQVLRIYNSAGVRLPDSLRGFLNERLPAGDVIPQRPDDAMIAALHRVLAAADNHHDESFFVAVALALRAGVGTMEVAAATSHWLVPPHHIAVQGRYARRVPLPPWLFRRLLCRLTGAAERPLVVSPSTQRKRLVKYFKDQGCPSAQPLQDCCCAYAAYLCSVMEPAQAQAVVGGFSLRTLESYAKAPLDENLLKLWDRPFNDLPIRCRRTRLSAIGEGVDGL